MPLANGVHEGADDLQNGYDEARVKGEETPTPTPAADAGSKRAAALSSSKMNTRVNIEAPLSQMRSLLGPDWPTYQDIVYEFVTGKLTRQELDEQFAPFIAEHPRFGMRRGRDGGCLLTVCSDHTQ